MKNNKSTYINSLEASYIYNHIIREGQIKDNFCGMIPFSLELLKLKKEGLKFKTDKATGKETSRDIINVKFKLKVQNIDYIISKNQEKLEKKYKNKEKSILGLKEYISKLKAEKTMENDKTIFSNIVRKKNKKTKKLEDVQMTYTKWSEMDSESLREYLYENGFTITTTYKKTNKETGEVTETFTQEHYVVYKRSSSKSKTGQCLFIKESLYQEMIAWSRMYLPFVEGMSVDYAGLLSYESLVGSALEDTIKINPRNILIVSDQQSKFKRLCNVIRKDDTTGRLNSFKEDYEIENELFDGESLLDSSLFKDGQGFMLLRNHMFKSASFNSNIQLYLKDHCPEGVEFDQWKIKNMFNQDIYAKNIKMIITPTSLKALKFAKYLNMTEEEIWEHWKKTVKKENNIFGICKHEKESKRGKDDLGNILQQTSYQMLNSMPLELSDIEELTQFEQSYIMKLKNNNKEFINYITEKATSINSNLMLADLAKRNKDFVNTEIFRDFRTHEINKYVAHCKNGKIRLNGDYCILLGNPMEYLQHAISQFDINTVDVEKLPLKDNEIYTKLHENNVELVCFRNPHTSSSNVLVAKNKYNDLINTYFNLSKNIVCVNSIKFQLSDILSGADFDSDSMLILQPSTKLLEVAHKCYDPQNVCINAMDSDKAKYKLTTRDMCTIDNILAKSQRNIGEVVNLGQWSMSAYHDFKRNGGTEEQLSKLMKNVDVMTILSGICIDLSKKLYDVNIKAEIKNVSKTEELGKLKPLFFKCVSQSENIKNKIKYYNCPMDDLNRIMSKFSNAETHHDIELSTLLIEKKVRGKDDRGQEKEIIKYVEDMCTKLGAINSEYKVYLTKSEREEKNNRLDDVVKFYNFKMQKRTVNSYTMYSIIKHLAINEDSKIKMKLLNILYTSQKKVFLNTFKQTNIKLM